MTEERINLAAHVAERARRQPPGRGWWWIPGHPRADGYRREHARVAVGPGWAPLADEAWLVATAAGGRLIQVKMKCGRLRVYALVPPEQEAEVEAIIARLEEKSETICEWCGAPGDGACATCRAAGPHWGRVDVWRFEEWIPR